ncbi:MAG: 1,4-dihydroxy-6-naphthoate synthase [Thermoleophilia bacterium]|nr:1,4-dihydroxy-6-naphthoate synthase [Thermoleophilia bacterium]
MTTTDLQFGFSPCPNDTFAFHALVHGLVDAPFTVTPVMADIEELNRRAHRGELPLTKLSFGALAQLRDTYEPLRAGAALGRGVGPLVVARDGGTLDDAAGRTIAIPGRDTTAFLLLRMALGNALGEVVELRYDQVLGAVERGEVDAGLIIHESRFTYADHGLQRLSDLGAWWEQRSGMPLPLATICVRRDVDPALRDPIEQALRASVQHAFDHPDDSAAWVREHAQEMDPDVQRRHIELYVNQYTLDLGDDGAAAITALLDSAIPA